MDERWCQAPLVDICPPQVESVFMWCLTPTNLHKKKRKVFPLPLWSHSYYEFLFCVEFVDSSSVFSSEDLSSPEHSRARGHSCSQSKNVRWQATHYPALHQQLFGTRLSLWRILWPRRIPSLLGGLRSPLHLPELPPVTCLSGRAVRRPWSYRELRAFVGLRERLPFGPYRNTRCPGCTPASSDADLLCGRLHTASPHRRKFV